MGSTSDLPVMEKAAKILDDFAIDFEMVALSAHRTQSRGVQVIIAGAGMAAALPGVIAANTTIPVIGVPISSSLMGMDALLAIVQMPPGIPVATVGIDAAQNAGLLAAQIISLSDTDVAAKFADYKQSLKSKIVKANSQMAEIKYTHKVN